jgi:hypothetical protein
MEVQDRLHLYKWTAALNNLKTTYPTFSTNNFNYDVWGFGKRLILNHNDMDAVVVGNFQVTGLNMVPGFQHTGTWYDYATGSPVEVNDLGASWSFQAGEFHVYTDMQLPVPDLNVSLDEIISFTGGNVDLYPNPATDLVNLVIDGVQGEKIRAVVYDVAGKIIADEIIGTGNGTKASYSLSTMDLQNGSYVLAITSGARSWSVPLVIAGN